MSLKIVSHWQGLTPDLQGAAVALGNFDGVHVGHQAVIATARDAARSLGAPLGVIRFTPHPTQVMRPDTPPFLLMTPAQQARVLEALGVDILYDLPFGPELSGLSDEAFCRQVLAWSLQARHVVAGFDIRFGAGRSGDADRLRHWGRDLGFGVDIVEAVSDQDGEKASSSAARDAVRAGDLERARHILGRPFAIEGVVVEGRKLGRTLGYPTANIELHGYVRPRLGVYATRTRLPDGRIQPGVANIGENPTTGVVQARLEVWLFDFDEDLYGQVLETELVGFIRPEAKFGSIDLMLEQILDDVAQAKRMLGA